jgi:succinate dehydrogenase / fumarate reductase cytochrome b subunit
VIGVCQSRTALLRATGTVFRSELIVKVWVSLYTRGPQAQAPHDPGVVTVKDNRPVNLDFSTMRLPITAYASITHRISGVFLVLACFILLALLDLSLSGPAGFAEAADILKAPVAKALIWAITTALIYHSMAGLRHLIMDFGVGESLEGGVLGARLVFVFSALASLATGVALW